MLSVCEEKAGEERQEKISTQKIAEHTTSNSECVRERERCRRAVNIFEFTPMPMQCISNDWNHNRSDTIAANSPNATADRAAKTTAKSSKKTMEKHTRTNTIPNRKVTLPLAQTQAQNSHTLLNWMRCVVRSWSVFLLVALAVGSMNIARCVVHLLARRWYSTTVISRL